LLAQTHHQALIGVSDNGAVQNGIVSVVMTGLTEVVAGENLVAGDHVSSGANGLAIPATNNKTVVGVVLESASAGDLVTISLNLSNH